MSSQPSEPLVLVVGGTGKTGQPLISALLEYGAFRVATLSRPASESKPVVTALKSKGVEIRLGDFTRDSPEQLESALEGVDILISLAAGAILGQKTGFEAAKKVGVRRIIPCDFGPACPAGVMNLHDDKLSIRSFVRELDVPYTFIDVGWWMQFTLPHPIGSPTGWFAEASREFLGEGDVKNAVTDVNDIGRFVARIIEDPRTINKYVFCWSEEVTQREVFEIADHVSEQKLSDAKVLVSAAEIEQRASTGKVEYERSRDFKARAMWYWNEYLYLLHVRGDNVVAKAKEQGALDARLLYPDFKPRTLEQYAQELYGGQIPQYHI